MIFHSQYLSLKIENKFVFYLQNQFQLVHCIYILIHSYLLYCKMQLQIFSENLNLIYLNFFFIYIYLIIEKKSMFDNKKFFFYLKKNLFDELENQLI